MIPPAPLADDWLYWDPYAIGAYPHSADPRDEPEQLELFDAPPPCRSELARE